jgi:hypothetical protein
MARAQGGNPADREASGPTGGAFLDQFSSVIQAKILREVAGTGDSSLIRPTGARADCLSGEKPQREEALGGEENP